MDRSALATCRDLGQIQILQQFPKALQVQELEGFWVVFLCHGAILQEGSTFRPGVASPAPVVALPQREAIFRACRSSDRRLKSFVRVDAGVTSSKLLWCKEIIDCSLNCAGLTCVFDAISNGSGQNMQANPGQLPVNFKGRHMTPELQMLFAAAVLQLALLVTHGAYISFAMGIKWGTGRRNTAVEVPDLGRRIERSLINSMEALSVFVPIMVLIHLIGLSDSLTLIGSATFVGARVIFVLLYIGNVPYLRTAVWLVGQASLFTLVIAIARHSFF